MAWQYRWGVQVTTASPNLLYSIQGWIQHWSVGEDLNQEVEIQQVAGLKDKKHYKWNVFMKSSISWSNWGY